MAMEGVETGNVVSSKKVGSGGGGNGVSDVVVELMGVIESAGSYSGFRKPQRKECCNLVRRLKLLLPLLEEVREIDSLVSAKALTGLANLKKALLLAKKLLKNCSSGSKIYLVSDHFFCFFFIYMYTHARTHTHI